MARKPYAPPYRTRAELRKAVKEGLASGSREYRKRIADYTKRHPGSSRSSARGHAPASPSRVSSENRKLRSAQQQLRAWIANGFEEVVFKWKARYPASCSYPGPGIHWQAVRIDAETALEYLKTNTAIEDAVVDISWTKPVCRPDEVLQVEIEEPYE